MALRNVLRAAAIAGAMALAACSTQGSAGDAAATVEPAVHPVSGLAIIPLTVTTASGQRHAFRVEVAATGQEQQRGLMFRTQMGADEGMIFPLAQVRMASFWMHNTVIPLDIIFIGPDRKVINIAANAVPYSDESLPSTAPAMAVLEINGGRSAALGIGPGDTVEW
jgi:uncharacterized membrane protein (UPF0127 family)